MKRVPYFAGAMLAWGAVVVALADRPESPKMEPTQQVAAVPPPVSEEMVNLFSVLPLDRGSTARPSPQAPSAVAPSATGGERPEAKLPAKPLTKTQPALQKQLPKPKAAASIPKRAPRSDISGHIL